MISEWVQNAMGTDVVLIDIAKLTTGLRGGEVAAIIVGCCFAAFVAVLATGVAIKTFTLSSYAGVSGKFMM
jgi:hypothetical protein